MAKYEIQHSCGHVRTHTIVGPTKDRPRRVAYLEDQLCSECWAERKREALARDNAAAAAANEDRGLPALTGTPRQIEWAESIRAEAAAKAAKLAPTPIRDGVEEEMGLPRVEIEVRVARADEAARRRVSEIMARTDAGWWIDHRDHVLYEISIARRDAVAAEFADVQARRDAARREDDDRRAAERRARDEEYQARANNQKAEAAKAASFRVSDRPGGVTVEGDEITIRSRDGRVAKGWILDGDWTVSSISDRKVPVTHPEMERIAREAHGLWEASR